MKTRRFLFEINQPFKVLQHAGLVPALVKLIEAHNTKNFMKHSCEEFICDMNKQSCEIEELQDNFVGKEDSDQIDGGELQGD